MALQKTVTHKGVEIKDCFIRVFQFNGNKTTLEFGVGYHSSIENEMFFSESYAFNGFVLDSTNPVKQAYEYLKTLSQFEGAADV